MESSQEVELFFHPLLLNSQKVLLALLEHDIAFIPNSVNVFRSKAYTEQFLSLSPSAELPILRINGKTYCTCNEILEVINSSNAPKQLDSITPNNNNDGERLDVENDVEKYLNALLCKLDTDALFHGFLYYFDEHGLSPKHPYDSEIFREKMKSMTQCKVSFLQSLIRKHPSCQEHLAKHRKKLQHSITTVQNKTRFNALLNKLTEIFGICERELKAKGNEDTWLFSTGKIKIVDIHFGLLLHHMYEFGFEGTVLWKNHPKIDNYYKRLALLKNFQQVINWPLGGGIARWKVQASQFLLFAIILGTAHWVLQRTQHKGE